jgi:hypothetical protein
MFNFTFYSNLLFVLTYFLSLKKNCSMKKFNAILFMLVFETSFLSAQPQINTELVYLVVNGQPAIAYANTNNNPNPSPSFSNTNFGSFTPSAGNSLRMAFPNLSFFLILHVQFKTLLLVIVYIKPLKCPQ